MTEPQPSHLHLSPAFRDDLATRAWSLRLVLEYPPHLRWVTYCPICDGINFHPDPEEALITMNEHIETHVAYPSPSASRVPTMG